MKLNEWKIAAALERGFQKGAAGPFDVSQTRELQEMASAFLKARGCDAELGFGASGNVGCPLGFLLGNLMWDRFA